MKLIALKPIYHNGNVVVEKEEFETNEQHARELVAKGYAMEVIEKLLNQSLPDGELNNDLPEPEPEPKSSSKKK